MLFFTKTIMISDGEKKVDEETSRIYLENRSLGMLYNEGDTGTLYSMYKHLAERYRGMARDAKVSKDFEELERINRKEWLFWKAYEFFRNEEFKRLLEK